MCLFKVLTVRRLIYLFSAGAFSGGLAHVQAQEMAASVTKVAAVT